MHDVNPPIGRKFRLSHTFFELSSPYAEQSRRVPPAPQPWSALVPCRRCRRGPYLVVYDLEGRSGGQRRPPLSWSAAWVRPKPAALFCGGAVDEGRRGARGTG